MSILRVWLTALRKKLGLPCNCAACRAGLLKDERWYR